MRINVWGKTSSKHEHQNDPAVAQKNNFFLKIDLILYLEYLISFHSLINLNIFGPYIIDLKIGLPQRRKTKLKIIPF